MKVRKEEDEEEEKKENRKVLKAIEEIIWECDPTQNTLLASKFKM